jgi:hypothetical protein
MIALELSEGRPNVPIAAVLSSALAMGLIAVAAIPSLDSTGVGLAMSGSALVSLVVLGFRVEPEMRAAAPALIRALAIGSLAAAAGYLAPLGDDLAGLIAQLLLIAGIWTVMAGLAMRTDLRSALRIARPMLPGRLGDRGAE